MLPISKYIGWGFKMEDSTKAGFIVFFVIAVIVSVIVMALGFDKVDADKIGVMDKFGVVQGKMDSGLRWTGLFVGVTEYPMTIQKLSLEKIESADSGGQSVYGDIAVNFKIKNSDIPLKMYREVGTTGDMNIIVNNLAIREKIMEGFKQVTTQYEALQILEKRDDVRQKTIERIEQLFPKEYFDIVSITISNIGYAQSFDDAIQLKKDNTQLALASQEKVKQFKAEADQKIEQARGEAESKKLSAEAIAYELRIQKEELTPLMVQRNWIDSWDGKLPNTLIIGGEGQDTNLLLPIQQTAEQK